MKRAGLLVLARPAARSGAGLLVLLLASPVLAQEAPGPDPVRLDYTRATGAEACPEESFLRTAVAARLGGRDVFTDGGERRITLALRRPGRGGYEADAALYDGTGRRLGSRELKESNCTRLVEAMGTVFVSWLLPILPPSPPVVAAPPAVEPLPLAPAAPSVAELAPPAPAAPPPAPPHASVAEPPPEARRPILFRAGAVARVEFGTGDRPAFGMTLDAGFRTGWFSLAGEFHWVPSATTSPTSGLSFSETLFAGALVACGHLGQRVAGVGCLLVEAGQTQLVPTLNRGAVEHVAIPYGGGGARVGVEVPLASPVYLQVLADLVGEVRHGFKLPGPAPVSGGLVGGLAVGLGAGLGATF